ncbi:hypothetical protein PENTCL1PPCAC_1492, partial [Pristionchus entomophagus]
LFSSERYIRRTRVNREALSPVLHQHFEKMTTDSQILTKPDAEPEKKMEEGKDEKEEMKERMEYLKEKHEDLRSINIEIVRQVNGMKKRLEAVGVESAVAAEAEQKDSKSCCLSMCDTIEKEIKTLEEKNDTLRKHSHSMVDEINVLEKQYVTIVYGDETDGKKKKKDEKKE